MTEPEPPCDCGPCVRAGHGQPAVTYAATRYQPAYELHGIDAAKFYQARDNALADLAALKVRLRHEKANAD